MRSHSNETRVHLIRRWRRRSSSPRRPSTPRRSKSRHEEQQALRARIEQRYDVVPLSGGVALTPKSPRGDVRLIEISDTIAINGVQVSGRELRERVGADADTILRLSYLDRDDLRKLFARAAPEAETRPEKSQRSNARRPSVLRPAGAAAPAIGARAAIACGCSATSS